MKCVRGYVARFMRNSKRPPFSVPSSKTPIKTFWAKGAQKHCVHMHCNKCVVFTPPVAHIEIAISRTRNLIKKKKNRETSEATVGSIVSTSHHFLWNQLDDIGSSAHQLWDTDVHDSFHDEIRPLWCTCFFLTQIDEGRHSHSRFNKTAPRTITITADRHGEHRSPLRAPC